MKKNSLVFLVALFSMLIFRTSRAQEIGVFFAGMNNYLVSDNDNEFNANTMGLSIGWMLPINISKMTVYYKVKATHHSVDDYENSSFEPKLKYFFSAINEILVGKNIKLNDQISILPQFGFGAIGEAAYYDWDKGITHGEAMMDFSFIAKYRISRLDIGMMFNFEKDIIPSSKSIIGEKRVNVSLLIAK